jgi:hypothetical protein
MTDLLILVALDVAGLVIIWFVLRARIRRALEIEGLLAEARKEIRMLSIEINETTDRNITLIEDRLGFLRDFLAEADRRLGVYRRELDNRKSETELYTRLGRAVPARDGFARGSPARDGVEQDSPRAARRPEQRIDAATAGIAAAVDEAAVAASAAMRETPTDEPARVASSAGEFAPLAPVHLNLSGGIARGPARGAPELVQTRESVIPPRPRREAALELHRQGFSADIIAAKLGATVSEIELLVSLEEGRQGGDSGS